jgi:hypothetical protein
MEALEPLGFMLIMLGLLLGFGVTALAAFYLIIARGSSNASGVSSSEILDS